MAPLVKFVTAGLLSVLSLLNRNRLHDLAMTRPGIFALFLLLVPMLALAGEPSTTPKSVEAIRTTLKPVIDGEAEDLWLQAPLADGFLQLNPTEGLPTSQHTEVRFLYSNTAIYVFAWCNDSAPDSILSQLGERDDNLNADRFVVRFDTYDSQLDAYVFGVFSSGVQIDYRMQDNTYNAVWNSAVKITEKGWQAEFEIPYSALRFPSQSEQEWGLQITRSIRRVREFDQWSLTPKNVDNPITFWGRLRGIRDIQTPVRLSVIPYLTLLGEHSTVDENIDPWSYRFAGGLDLKYGLNESFTLDMTLLPDFSQVQSDNQVKNLGAFEVVFEEQRQFFQEGVELFSSGGLFYTRRIGGPPKRAGSVEDQLAEGEELLENPGTAGLLNASKISGRTNSGVGIGFFNAVTGNTFATIRTAEGEQRKFLTDPLTNYNIAVVDKNLRNNSRVYLINTNVTRNGSWYDANVTSAGVRLVNKKNSWRVNASGAHSILYGLDESEHTDATKQGSTFNSRVERIKGRWRGAASFDGISPDYDHNDMGILFTTGQLNAGGWVGYNIFDPVWKINNAWFSLETNSRARWTTGQILSHDIGPSFGVTFRNFFTVWGGMEILTQDFIDYWEPRVEGRYFNEPRYAYAYGGWSSDYRKRLAIDGSLSYGESNRYGYSFYNEQYLEPILRVSDKFTVRWRSTLEREGNDQGFSTFGKDDEPIFGGRNVTNWTQRFQAKYLFKNNLSLSLRARHLWSVGTYHVFYDLQENGDLIEREWDQNQDFNFNAFNVDLVFSWQVAPGSFLRVVYKNAILDDATEIERDYLKNFQRTLGLAQTNSLSARLVWYLDYLDLKKERPIHGF